MPYIALQLVGMQAVLEVIGLGGAGSVLAKDAPLLIAFAVLAAYTYSSGLRAPAVIAFVKDALIYLVIAVAVIYLPHKFGGWSAIFGAAEQKMTSTSAVTGKATGVFIPGPTGFAAYWTLALPQLFADSFPSWFAGIAFAAIAVGALVPAAIMSIAAANLFTRNIYRAYFVRDATPAREAKVSKLVSLVVKLGALGFVLLLDKQNALNFQLLGGIWILQTFPTIVFGLFTRWFNKWALLAGWAAGMVYGTLTAYNVVNPTTGEHFGGSITTVPFLGAATGYIGLTALVLNAVIATALTLILRAALVRDRADETTAADYFLDRASAGAVGKPTPPASDTGSATAAAR